MLMMVLYTVRHFQRVCCRRPGGEGHPLLEDGKKVDTDEEVKGTKSMMVISVIINFVKFIIIINLYIPSGMW